MLKMSYNIAMSFEFYGLRPPTNFAKKGGGSVFGHAHKQFVSIKRRPQFAMSIHVVLILYIYTCIIQ